MNAAVNVMPAGRWLENADFTRWDAFELTHPAGSIFATSSWKRVLELSFPHIRGRLLVFEDPSSHEIKFGLPIYLVSSRLLGNRWVSIPFASFCDPLVSSEVELDGLLSFLRSSQCFSTASVLEIRTWKKVSSIDKQKLTCINNYKHHYIQLMDNEFINNNPFTKRKFRYSVERATKSGITVISDLNSSTLQSFYSLLSSGRKRLGLPSIPFSFFNAIYTVFGHKGLLLLTALKANRPVGSMFLLLHNGVCAGEYVADSPDARPDGVNQLLLKTATDILLEKKYKLFSLGRTSPSNLGLMAYKNKLATHIDDLPVFSLRDGNHAISQDRESSLAYKLLRLVCKYAPTPVYNQLSSFCYKHLG